MCAWLDFDYFQIEFKIDCLNSGGGYLSKADKFVMQCINMYCIKNGIIYPLINRKEGNK